MKPGDYANEAYRACLEGRADVNQQKSAAAQIILLHARNAELRDALRGVIQATHSHVDGRDLLAELHPRRMLDIKRRRDGVETWFQGDWLSTLWGAVKIARAALAKAEAA